MRMPPRLAHRKSRAGCMRCKTRKVKCDEILPKCSACVRHNVACVYPGSTTGVTSPVSIASRDLRAAEHALELRLMHEWMVRVCKSFTIAWEFWRHQAPLIAFEHRYLLDALLALSALHLARTGPEVWDPVEGRMRSLHENESSSASVTANTTTQTASAATPQDRHDWKAVTRSNEQTPTSESSPSVVESPAQLRRHHHDMLHVSRTYFDRALDGQRKAVAWLSEDSIQAVYMCSILVNNYGFLSLSEAGGGGGDDNDTAQDTATWDPIKWFRIAEGSRHIAQRWHEMVGTHWFHLAGNLYGSPDLSDNDELFHPRHRVPFAHLLADVDSTSNNVSNNGDSNNTGSSGGGGGTSIAPDDRIAYEHTLSYVGLLYRGIADRSDLPLASCRRLIALPSRVPPRFAVLIEEQHPRALVILAYALAATKLLESDLPWYKGVADLQVPLIAAALPKAWGQMLEWLLRIVEKGLDGLSWQT